MLRGLFILSFFLVVFGLGFAAPFMMMLGYLWADIFRPASVSYLMGYVPIGDMLAGGALITYILMDRREPPRVTFLTVLLLLFTLWMTATTTWAVLQVDAWIAWSETIKVMLFALFIPYVIRSRIQIEAFIVVFIFAMAATFLAYGAKTFVSGGSYGSNLGISDAVYVKNGEILSGICMMAVALIIFVMKHGRIFPQTSWVKLGYISLTIFAIATVIGTHARTGLVVLVVFAAVRWFVGRGKIGWAAVYVAAALAIVTFAPERWTERMATIINGAPAATEQARTRVRLAQVNPGEGPELDESAAVRLIMWQWTIDYALQNPWGGGFDLYKVSRAGNERVLQRRAYHSSFFQVLGEQGWLGLFLFLGMNAVAMWYAFKAKRIAKRRPELTWIRDLSIALITGQMCLLAAGAFTDMAFHPPFYYIFSLAICLHEYVRRIQEPYATARPAATAALPLPGGVVAGVSAGMAHMQAQHTLNARQRP